MPEQDAMILRMRDAGEMWDDIAAAVGHSRNATKDRGKLLLILRGTPEGALTRRTGPAAPKPEAPPSIVERPTLPPLSDESWRLICAGTCLAGDPPPKFQGWGRLL